MSGNSAVTEREVYIMRTWLKWIGDKHQQFHDWAEAENIPTWKSIIRIIIFYMCDAILLTAALVTVLVLFFIVFGKLFTKDEPIILEE